MDLQTNAIFIRKQQMQKLTLCLLACIGLVTFLAGWRELEENTAEITVQKEQTVGGDNRVSKCDPSILYRAGGLPAIKHRDELGALLERKHFETGAEIGVQTGDHASVILQNWKSCNYFAAIDSWMHQESSVGPAIVDAATQQFNFEKARYALLPWEKKVHFFRMLSVDAAEQIEDNSLDFVYVDARHDYCGCMEDMLAYWPKLRPGGIMAGHDYMTNEEVRSVAPTLDFGLCMNGTRNEGAVRGAVHDFALARGLTVSVTYQDGGVWSSWMVQKPTIEECVRGQMTVER